ncbi:SpoIIE family protein phosphatase [Waterburya agarophytonicola K14]|uniref:histidine kinase n=1 Tax=Waterburya agarophytonicola KI4 TaxID=2874699 RepID=A0A964FH76_9CYAN|nr:SpoIIE family protein phosphatase [Waterburya agarophytonicola]MCC0177359.1 SpoIIE family protein phosphatase [Waterburya agarophytonicola KI4]
MTTDSQSQLSLSHLRHELRTPINAIIGYSEMIVEEFEDLGSDPPYLQELEEIRDCGAELLVSINNFLNPAIPPTSELEWEQIVTNPELKIQLQKLTNLVINNCQQLIPTIETELVPDVEKINLAANKLLEEINNLLKTSPGKNSLTISPKIPPQVVEEDYFFEPETISEIDIIIDSGVLLAQEDEQPLDPSKYTILIVDDNATNRDLLSRQVKTQGYKAAVARDGRQAIQKIKTGAYDLILLDIIMPEINGYQVLKWIRAGAWRHIPTIMISALDEIDSVVKCIEMGAADYLAKPFNPTLLKARLGACLEQKRLRDQESSYLDKLALANEEIKTLNGCLKAENMRLSTELEVTQRLQMMLLPKEQELSQIEGLEIAGFMEPADEVGGDYYDVLQHHGRITIGIGDVTGHGLESGVLMLMVQTAVRTLMENNETDPKKFFEVLNRTIYKNVQRMDSDKNLSLCLVNYHEGVLNLSGQHEEMLVIRAGGTVERVDTIDLGFPIGLEETIEDFVFQAQINLHQGDVVILYTDGITEAENNLGIHYGLENLCAIVQQNWQESAQDIRQAVIENLRSHIGVEKVYDDITLVVLKQK